jgi:uncharacterized membrane protein (DUF2068 family)
VRIGRERPLGVTALSIFFTLGTIPSIATALALAFPGAWSDAMWQFKPRAQQDFSLLGVWAIPLMLVVAVACAGAAAGLWKGRRWGYRIALGLLSINLLGDVFNAFVRGDWRTLIGIPIGGAMLAYLLSPAIRKCFGST